MDLWVKIKAGDVLPLSDDMKLADVKACLIKAYEQDFDEMVLNFAQRIAQHDADINVVSELSEA